MKRRSASVVVLVILAAFFISGAVIGVQGALEEKSDSDSAGGWWDGVSINPFIVEVKDRTWCTAWRVDHAAWAVWPHVIVGYIFNAVDDFHCSGPGGCSHYHVHDIDPDTSSAWADTQAKFYHVLWPDNFWYWYASCYIVAVDPPSSPAIAFLGDL